MTKSTYVAERDNAIIETYLMHRLSMTQREVHQLVHSGELFSPGLSVREAAAAYLERAKAGDG